MWRALFLALGAYGCLLGLQCLVIDKAVIARRGGVAESETIMPRDVVPPDWAPWSLMSAGAVTILYSFTLPRKKD
jgi:hypothetical protein